MPIVLGIDAAWTATQPSGIALVARGDVGRVDVGRVDVGRVDVGRVDVDRVDVDRVDVDRVDVGRVDVGRVDVGRVDVGRGDVGRVDVGRVDVNRVDVGRVDVDPVDVGRVDIGRWRCLALAPSYASFVARGRVDWRAKPAGGVADCGALIDACIAIAGAPPDVIAIDMPLARRADHGAAGGG